MRAVPATVTVNGTAVPLDGTPPHTTALDWLRGLGLTGAKEGCAEGECGACAVLLARPGLDAATEWTALNACLLPAAALAGQELVTAEGLGTPEALHPVQRELASRGGSQCGYCTPGFVCSMAAEFYRPGRKDFDLLALSGNLCRCTGYRPIRDAAYALGPPEADDPLAVRRDAPPPTPVRARTDGFVRPADLAEAFDVLREHPDAEVTAGCTDTGVDVNLKGARPALTVAVDQLPELRELVVTDDAIEVGAALTLTEIERRVGARVPLLDQMLPLFASRLIRNSATLGGNLATASPIGDAAPVLIALRAAVLAAGPDGRETGGREIPVDGFFTGYRETALRPGELIRAVRIPLPLAGFTAFHKISKRRLDDISSVAIGFALTVEDGTVTGASIGLGGVAATPLRARATEAALVGRPWTADIVREAARVMAGEGTPIDDQRASAAYRSAMLGNALLRLYDEQLAEARA